MGLLIHKLVLAPLATNAYLVGDDLRGECIVVDPASQGQRILDEMTRLRLRAKLILATHGHADHVGAVAFLKEATGALFAMHPRDVSLVNESGVMFGHGVIPGYRDPPTPDIELKEGDDIEVGEFTFRVLETPGHTPGGVSLYGHGVLLSGDTLFQEGIGRYDLPGGDGPRLLDSIRTRLLDLPDDTQVLPGHGPSTTIGWERRYNPFLQAGEGGQTHQE